MPPTVGAQRRSEVRLRLGIVALMVLGFLTGCGSKAAPNAGAVGTPTGAGTTSTSRNVTTQRAGGTVKLTGFYTYDGPFSGQFDCSHHNGYFELQSTKPYQIWITVKQMHEGKYIVNPQNPATGYSDDVPGQGFVDVRRLDPPDYDPNTPTFRQNGGTPTFADGGDTGTLVADYVDIRDASHTVHVEMTWKDCR